MNKSYSELIKFKTFRDRLEYLKLFSKVGEESFGFLRYLNQIFYNSRIWEETRTKIIIRDLGLDLGLEGYYISGKIICHHINPITLQDIYSKSDKLYDPDNLICVSHSTHNRIHYCYKNDNYPVFKERKPKDTILW